MLQQSPVSRKDHTLMQEGSSGQGLLPTSHLPQHVELHGDENFLVGITPQYWAHVPMFIDDILHHLALSEGGINFLLPQRIPVSKCLLVGRIVWSQQASDNAIRYVLDDGTGLIDCECYDNHNDVVYELPSLTSSCTNGDYNRDDYKSKKSIALGTCVKVFGKIKNLAISNGRVVREIGARLMEPVQESFCGNYNPEFRHWMTCARFQASLPKVAHPLGCLQTLGDHIQAQVRAKRRLPSADDTLGAWRIFGAQCQCTCDQSIRDSLLYCHCQAKVIVSDDQQFQYRDALLKHLLMRQKRHAKKLVFVYQDIQKEELLKQVAMKQAGSNNKVTKSFFHEELIRATVRALVKDGIIFHIDPESDSYLLITREKVLEPFVRDELERTGNMNNFVSLKGAPSYLDGVDLEKFMYIKRCLVQQHNDAKRQRALTN